jgi:hypothetical protein
MLPFMTRRCRWNASRWGAITRRAAWNKVNGENIDLAIFNSYVEVDRQRGHNGETCEARSRFAEAVGVDLELQIDFVGGGRDGLAV